VSRGEHLFCKKLRTYVIAKDLDMPEEDVDKQVNAFKTEHHLDEIGLGELSNIYAAVWDKEVLSVVDLRKYGEELAELFDDCDIADNIPKQKQIKVHSGKLSP
jgi:hypothetical protein